MAPAPFHSVSFEKKKQKKTTRNKNKTQSSPLPIPVSWLSVDLFTVLMNILHGNNQPLHPRKLKFYTYHPQPQPQPQQQQHQNTKKNTEPNQKKNWWGLDFRLVTLTTPLTRWHYKQTNQQTNKQQTNQPTNRLLVRTAAKTKQQRVVWLIDWFFFWSLAKKKKARNRTAIVALSFPRSSFFFCYLSFVDVFYFRHRCWSEREHRVHLVISKSETKEKVTAEAAAKTWNVVSFMIVIYFF